jgi:hypothetical protein
MLPPTHTPDHPTLLLPGWNIFSYIKRTSFFQIKRLAQTQSERFLRHKQRNILQVAVKVWRYVFWVINAK